MLYRLSVSDQRDRFILKGGMLVTLWIDGGNRETRDADFLGHGDANQEKLKATFAEIMAIATDDGLVFDTQGLTATTIREEMEYGGVRLRTTAFLERSRIPVTIDIGFGDALAAAAQPLAYPSLLGMVAAAEHKGWLVDGAQSGVLGIRSGAPGNQRLGLRIGHRAAVIGITIFLTHLRPLQKRQAGLLAGGRLREE